MENQERDFFEEIICDPTQGDAIFYRRLIIASIAILCSVLFSWLTKITLGEPAFNNLSILVPSGLTLISGFSYTPSKSWITKGHIKSSILIALVMTIIFVIVVNYFPYLFGFKKH
jgi:hypothetical protein